MPEKEKEEKKRIKIGEERVNKPSLWQRIKKPLAAGILAAGLLITPMKKAEGGEFDVSLGPITGEAAKEIELKYPEYWKRIIEYDKVLISTENDDQITISINDVEEYKKIYTEFKDDYTSYLFAYRNYQKALDSRNYKDEIKHLENVISTCDSTFTHPKIQKEMLKLQMFAYYNMARIYYEGYLYTKNEDFKDKAKITLIKGLVKYNKKKKSITEEERYFLENGENRPIYLMKRLFELVK
ncbi:MAG: hypothetical protein N2312_01735 [Dictyoglomaceae bacterium]|nr:hypothetical protein [Dictyoglomaceae bacterium]